jgi:hypothetical protein
MNIETPFKVGQTYWKAKSHCEQVKVPCPVCAGKRVVVVIDGYDKQWTVECDSCGIGHDYSRGYVHEYDYTPDVEPFTIANVVSYREGEWYVKDLSGNQINWDNLYATKEEAMGVSRKHMTELIEHNHRTWAARKQSDLKKKCWTLRYHQEAIRRFKKQLEWHESKISQLKLEKMEQVQPCS